MRLFHISDLHIGKQLNLYDLSEVQRQVFSQIVSYAKKEKPDAILIAGDIYDKTAPSGEAFKLFDEFLNDLSGLEPSIPVMIISGNHDSKLRLNFASEFLKKHNIFISAETPKSADEHIKKIVLSDEAGNVNFYLMPFVRPASARNVFGEEKDIKTYDEAFSALLEREDIDYSERNVLLAHQFFVAGGSKNNNDKSNESELISDIVIEPKRRESELTYISVGGIDSINTCHVEKFDYVALGHIHTAQEIGKPYIRYSGTPLKYSVSESDDEKYITVAELGKKGDTVDISFLPLSMKPDVKKLKGTLEDVIKMAREGDIASDYVSIILTDSEPTFNPKERLREFFTNILDITLDKDRIKSIIEGDSEEFENEDPASLFGEFFKEMNGRKMSEDEEKILLEVIDNISRA